MNQNDNPGEYSDIMLLKKLFGKLKVLFFLNNAVFNSLINNDKFKLWHLVLTGYHLSHPRYCYDFCEIVNWNFWKCLTFLDWTNLFGMRKTYKAIAIGGYHHRLFCQGVFVRYRNLHIVYLINKTTPTLEMSSLIILHVSRTILLCSSVISGRFSKFGRPSKIMEWCFFSSM